MASMDCIGSVCGDNYVSFFGINSFTQIQVYDKYQSNESNLSSIIWHSSKDQLICGSNQEIFLLNSNAKLSKLRVQSTKPMKVRIVPPFTYCTIPRKTQAKKYIKYIQHKNNIES